MNCEECQKRGLNKVRNCKPSPSPSGFVFEKYTDKPIMINGRIFSYCPKIDLDDDLLILIEEIDFYNSFSDIKHLTIKEFFILSVIKEYQNEQGVDYE